MCKQFSDAHTSNLTQATAAHYLTLEPHGRRPQHRAQNSAERARVMADCLRKELGSAIEFNQPQGGMFFLGQTHRRPQRQ